MPLFMNSRFEHFAIVTRAGLEILRASLKNSIIYRIWESQPFGCFRFVLLPYGKMAMIFPIRPTSTPTMKDIQLLLDGYTL